MAVENRRKCEHGRCPIEWSARLLEWVALNLRRSTYLQKKRDEEFFIKRDRSLCTFFIGFYHPVHNALTPSTIRKYGYIPPPPVF